ncbi:PEP-CTERM sorting domain-containing protein [Roseateles sp. DXS20W]|uniref:PEP-CTERM sorting domain-containing protein n=1 Tax=Pelomonas lactea TaxID=3299030 RepID=A0ABW7GJT3_9BURK
MGKKMHRSRIFKGLLVAGCAAASLGVHAVPVPGVWVDAKPGGNGSLTQGGGDWYRSATIDLLDKYGNQATSFGSLADGSLHSMSFSTPNQPASCNWKLGTGPCNPSAATSSVTFRDKLVFDGSKLKEPGVIKWKFTIDGSEDDGPGGYSRSNAWAQFGASIGLTASNLNWHYVQNGDTIAGEIMMPGGPESTLELWVTAGLATYAYHGGSADYSHTARFSWDLPAGLTYWSQSGVFMADHPPVPSVPEPSSLALVSAGLLAICFRVRRTKQVQRPERNATVAHVARR